MNEIENVLNSLLITNLYERLLWTKFYFKLKVLIGIGLVLALTFLLYGLFCSFIIFLKKIGILKYREEEKETKENEKYMKWWNERFGDKEVSPKE